MRKTIEEKLFVERDERKITIDELLDSLNRVNHFNQRKDLRRNIQMDS